MSFLKLFNPNNTMSGVLKRFAIWIVPIVPIDYDYVLVLQRLQRFDWMTSVSVKAPYPPNLA